MGWKQGSSTYLFFGFKQFTYPQQNNGYVPFGGTIMHKTSLLGSPNSSCGLETEIQRDEHKRLRADKWWR